MKWMIIATVIAVGAGTTGYLLLSGDDDSSTNNSSQASESTDIEENQSTTELSTLNKLLANNENIECTYAYEDEDLNNSSGTAYMSDGRMFGEFYYTQADGTEYESSVLSVDETQYVWDNNTKEGYMFSIIDDIETNTDDSSSTQGPDQDEEFEFNCKKWDVDESKFEVPSDVTFTDTSEALQGLGDVTDQALEACEALTGEAKTSCEQAVGAL